MRAVVLLELDQAHGELGCCEVALEVLHVRDVGAAERVDRLVVVADREHGGVRPCQRAQPLVLEQVRVLELVDEQVREAPAVVLAKVVALREELVAAQQELGEVHDAFALAHRLVERVMLDLPSREVVAGLDGVGPQPLLLRVGNEIHELPRRITVVVDVVRLVQALDQRQLVLRVEDLEQLRQVRIAKVRAQQPVAQAVERPDPHAARAHGGQRGEPQHHLPRGLVRERDGEDGERACLTGGEQPRDARRQHARLAASRAREDQRGRVRKGDGSKLLGIEVFEKRRGHAVIGTLLDQRCPERPVRRDCNYTVRDALDRILWEPGREFPGGGYNPRLPDR